MDKYTKIGEILYDLFSLAYSRGYLDDCGGDETAEIIKEYLNMIINLEGL